MLVHIATMEMGDDEGPRKKKKVRTPIIRTSGMDGTGPRAARRTVEGGRWISLALGTGQA